MMFIEEIEQAYRLCEEVFEHSANGSTYLANMEAIHRNLKIRTRWFYHGPIKEMEELFV